MLLSVSDTGTGIDLEEQPLLFNRFYQGKNLSENQTGYGIGLNLAKEYCELMNGKIWFESQPGKGTTFFVEIPVKDFAVPKNHKSTITQTINTIKTNDENSKIQEKIGHNTRSIILLVDDHPDTIEFIRISLTGKYNFVSAANGKEALKILEKQKIDLIVSDVMMPEIDGLTLCEQVKGNPKYSNIPIILLTALAMADNQLKGIRAGADDYLIKPFDTDLLEARIESLLYRNQKVDDYIKQKMIIENHQEVEIESYNERLLQEAIKYINQHINDTEINIDKMCKAIGVSHSSLYRKLKTQTGLTLNELIRNVKLKKAAQLIKTGKYSISEIMDETGFTNHSYFAKCFKTEYGMSPREFAEKK